MPRDISTLGIHLGMPLLVDQEKVLKCHDKSFAVLNHNKILKEIKFLLFLQTSSGIFAAGSEVAGMQMSYIPYVSVAMDTPRPNHGVETLSVLSSPTVQATSLSHISQENHLHSNPPAFYVMGSSAATTQTNIDYPGLICVREINSNQKQMKSSASQKPKKGKKKKNDPDRPKRFLNPKSLQNLKQYRGWSVPCLSSIQKAKNPKGLEIAIANKKRKVEKKKSLGSCVKLGTRDALSKTMGTKRAASNTLTAIKTKIRTEKAPQDSIETKKTTSEVSVESIIATSGDEEPEQSNKTLNTKHGEDFVGVVQDGLVGKIETRWLGLQLAETTKVGTERGAKVKAQKKINQYHNDKSKN